MCWNLVPKVATLEDGIKYKGLRGGAQCKVTDSQERWPHRSSCTHDSRLSSPRKAVIKEQGPDASVPWLLNSAPELWFLVSPRVILSSHATVMISSITCDTARTGRRLFAFFSFQHCELSKPPRSRVFSYSNGGWTNTGSQQ